MVFVFFVISYLKPNVGHFSIFWRFLAPGCPSSAVVLSQCRAERPSCVGVTLRTDAHMEPQNSITVVDPESGGSL